MAGLLLSEANFTDPWRFVLVYVQCMTMTSNAKIILYIAPLNMKEIIFSRCTLTLLETAIILETEMINALQAPHSLWKLHKKPHHTFLLNAATSVSEGCMGFCPSCHLDKKISVIFWTWVLRTTKTLWQTEIMLWAKLSWAEPHMQTSGLYGGDVGMIISG